MINRLKYHPAKLAPAVGPMSLATRLNRAAPMLIIMAVIGLAMAITLDEWRSGTLGSSRVVEAQEFTFERQTNGTMAVYRAADRALVATLPSAEEGFIAMTIKSLGRERRKFSVSESAPYRLARLENGRLNLVDPVIGTRVELIAFGPTNIGAFAALMPPAARPAKFASQQPVKNY
jgi:putative photosynthetic complex assembly protein